MRKSFLAATVVLLGVVPCIAQQSSNNDPSRLPARPERLRIDRNTGMQRDPYMPSAVMPIRPDIPGPVTSDPAAFRAWLRRKISEDLVKLDEATRELLAALDGDVDRKKAVDQARKIIKTSHNTWYNLQMRKPTRERPKLEEHPTPRSLADARTDALAVRKTLDSLAHTLIEQERSREVDALQRAETLDMLESLQVMANQICMDAKAGN